MQGSAGGHWGLVLTGDGGGSDADADADGALPIDEIVRHARLLACLLPLLLGVGLLKTPGCEYVLV